MLAIGLDIGGTKSAVCLGRITKHTAEIIHRCAPFSTLDFSPDDAIELMSQDILQCKAIAAVQPEQEVVGVGVACGGPLDSDGGFILSPPNLPGWNRIAITQMITQKTGYAAWLCNDANAGALAEWRFGAGRDVQNMIFLTFGTGLGAGLIFDGRLYRGANDMAGEVGHVRISSHGPAGYGKTGSLEGFCSGGGIAQLAKTTVFAHLQRGEQPALCPNLYSLEKLTAQRVGEMANKGDSLSREILAVSGRKLGEGLSLLIDLLNPEKIVIGGIFARCYDYLWPEAKTVVEAESLAVSRGGCEIMAGALGESIGDVAALTVAASMTDLFGG